MINNLPNKWKIEKLENISKIQAGGTPSRTKSEYWNGNIPWLKISNLKSKFTDKATEFITEEGLKNSSTKLFEENTILYTIFATLGEVSILKIKATTNQAIAGITITNSNVSLEYIYYYLKSIKEKVINEGRGVAQNNINLSILRNIEIPIPPLQQQEKIVKVLDLSSNLIEKQKELLKNYDLFLKSKFIEMFGEPSKNVMNWNIEKFEKYIEYIGDIGSNGSNAVISKNLKMLDTEDYALMIRTTNLNKNDFINDVKYVSEETYNFFKKSKIFGGEIIMNKIGSAGKFWKMPYLNKPVSLGLNQLVIRLKNLNTEYLYYLLSTEYGQLVISSKTNGAVTQSITKGAVKDIDIMIPPIELQNKFASIVERIEIIKEKENQKLKQLENLHNSLMQKAFKGEIE